MAVKEIGSTTRLTPLTREVLNYLVEHRGIAVDKNKVPVIGLEYQPGRVSFYVNELRRIIGKEKIETLHGFGYRYVG